MMEAHVAHVAALPRATVARALQCMTDARPEARATLYFPTLGMSAAQFSMALALGRLGRRAARRPR